MRAAGNKVGNKGSIIDGKTFAENSFLPDPAAEWPSAVRQERTNADGSGMLTK
jgi:hypothetical protein